MMVVVSVAVLRGLVDHVLQFADHDRDDCRQPGQAQDDPHLDCQLVQNLHNISGSVPS